MQKTLIIGHLGKEAEVKEVNGKQFVSFTLADSNKRKTATGEIIDSVTWYECTMNLTNVLPYLKKGQQVMVIGRSYATGYVSKQTGEIAVAMKCVVQELQLLGSPSGNTGSQPAAGQQAPAAQPVQQQQPQTAMMPAEGDDDLPF